MRIMGRGGYLFKSFGSGRGVSQVSPGKCVPVTGKKVLSRTPRKAFSAEQDVLEGEQKRDNYDIGTGRR